jgi:hypothetical protein
VIAAVGTFAGAHIIRAGRPHYMEQAVLHAGSSRRCSGLMAEVDRQIRQ